MELITESHDERTFWTEFIKLYRHFPVLWTKKGDDDGLLQDNNLRGRALKILLRKYRDLQPTATLSDVKKVLKSLHSAYRKELRLALEQELRSTAGQVSTVYESPWWCFKLLNFLRSQEETGLKIKLLEEEDANILEQDDVNTYSKNLADAIRKLSAEQQQFVKAHIDTILHCGQEGMLTIDWPSLGTNNVCVGCNCPASNKMPTAAREVRTVKGTVRFRKHTEFHSAYKVQSPEKRNKRTINDKIVDEPSINDVVENEQFDTNCVEELSIANIAATDDDNVSEDAGKTSFQCNSSDDGKFSMSEGYENMEKIEISLVDAQELPRRTEQPNFNCVSLKTDANADVKSFVSVRMPSGPTIRRQCTVHFSHYVDKVVPEYSDSEFVTQFRVGRDIVQMLCTNLEAACSYKKLKGHGGYDAISPQTHVLAFLWFLGQEKASYRNVADRFELSLSCLHDVIWRVCESILTLKGDVIVTPDDAKKESSAKHFIDSYALPGVIGCIAGTHIKIDKPIENSDRFLLRKGCYSMQVQAVFDEHLQFLDVFVEYPGEPDMFAIVKNLCGDRYCLLGGDEYPCLPQLLVPYRTGGLSLTTAQKSLNDRLHKAQRSCVTVFQNLKHRFRQLYHLKGRQLSRSVKLIRACCILYNLASKSDITLFENEANERPEEPYISAAVCTYSSESHSELEVALGQQRRDAILAEL